LRRKRVTVLYQHPLFGFGIQRVLSEDPEFEVVDVRALPADGAGVGKGLDTDVIVAEGEDPDTLSRLVTEFPPVLVVFVRLDSNLIDVYHNREVVFPPPASLAEALSGTKKPASVATRTSATGTSSRPL